MHRLMIYRLYLFKIAEESKTRIEHIMEGQSVAEKQRDLFVWVEQILVSKQFRLMQLMI